MAFSTNTTCANSEALIRLLVNAKQSHFLKMATGPSLFGGIVSSNHCCSCVSAYSPLTLKYLIYSTTPVFMESHCLVLYLFESHVTKPSSKIIKQENHFFSLRWYSGIYTLWGFSSLIDWLQTTLCDTINLGGTSGLMYVQYSGLYDDNTWILGSDLCL